MSNKNILIVEDETVLAFILPKILRDYNYSVSIVSSVKDNVIESITGLHPDLILMDINLNGDYDGIEVAGEIRKISDIPIIYVSSQSDEDTLRRAKLTNPSGFFSKPIAGMEISFNISLALQKYETEKRFRESERHFRLLYEKAPLGYYSLDMNAHILEVNNKWLSTFGYKRKDVIGRWFGEFMTLVSARLFSIKFPLFLSKDEIDNSEFEIICKNGARIMTSFNSCPVHDQTGKFIHVYCIMNNITEKRMNEDELQMNKEMLSTARDLTHMGSYYYNLPENKNYCSEEILRIFGLNPLLKSLPLKDFLTYIHSDDKFKLIRTICKAMKENKDFEAEFRLSLKDNELKYVYTTGRTVANHTGKVMDIHGALIDVTGIMKTEAELKHQLAIVHKKEITLKSTLGELNRSNKDLEQFTYIVSHDLKEPIRMIIGYSQLLSKHYKEKLDNRGNEYLFFLNDSTTRMQGLVSDLLTYSQLNINSCLSKFECNEVLNDVLHDLKLLITESGAKINIGNLPCLKADMVQLRQLFQNLISNAIKFRSEKIPEISIEAKTASGYFIFSVEDNGIGIKPEFFDKIFIIFQRLHEREKYPGNGIGLSVCKKIIERHGGRIWITSKLNKGTTIYFALPRTMKFQKYRFPIK
ncbi:MAG: ATP-binding protein [Ignavibacteria bacterium]